MARPAIELSTQPALRRFADALSTDLHADRVILFGSRARGTERPDSDHDFIVVTRDYETVEMLDRGVGLYQLWRRSGGNGAIDVICLTPEEFEYARTHITLVNAVLPEGIDLLPEPCAARFPHQPGRIASGRKQR